MIALIIFAILFALLGIAGCIVPGLPGLPLNWIGILLMYFADKVGNSDNPLTLTVVFIWLGVTILASVFDYIIPPRITRMVGGHKAASIGAMIGLFLGMIIPPIGIIVGSLLGAFIGELLVTDKGVWTAFKAGGGAFIGFMLSTGMKLCLSGVMTWIVVKYAFIR